MLTITRLGIDDSSMYRIAHGFRVAGALITLAVLLTACGNSTSNSAAPTASSAPATAPADTAPAPSGLKAVPHLTTVTLLFSGAPQYQVRNYAVEYRKPGGHWKPVNRAPSKASSATVDHLAPGTTYEFRVAAINEAGRGPWTAPVATATLKDSAFADSSDQGDDKIDSCGINLGQAGDPGGEIVDVAGEYIKADNNLYATTTLWLDEKIDAKAAAARFKRRIAQMSAAYEQLAPYRGAKFRGVAAFVRAIPAYHKAEIALAQALLDAAQGGPTAGLDAKSEAAATLRRPVAHAWRAWAAYCGIDLKKPSAVDPES